MAYLSLVPNDVGVKHFANLKSKFSPAPSKLKVFLLFLLTLDKI